MKHEQVALLRRSLQPAHARPALPAGELCVSMPHAEPLVGQAIDDLAFCAGLKPVMKLEEHGDAERIEARRLEIEARWPGVHTRYRWPASEIGRDWELFVSRNPALLDEAFALANRIETEKDPRALAAAIDRIGALLGYPACCASSFATVPRIFRSLNEWLWVKRRLESPGPFEPCVHPVLLSHVPCSLACAATTSLVRASLRHAAGDTLPRLATLPSILFFDRPGEFVMLDPQEPPADVFRYRVEAWRTADPRLAALVDGDTLRLEPGMVRVFGAGRETAVFGLDAFLWWSERVFYAELWRECVQVVESSLVPDTPPVVEHGTPETVATPAPNAEEEERTVLCDRLRQVVKALVAHPTQPLFGFVLEVAVAHDAPSGYELDATLRRGDERLRFFLKPRAAAAAAFRTTAHFALMHDRATPPDTDEKRQVLAIVLRAFDEATSGR